MSRTRKSNASTPSSTPSKPADQQKLPTESETNSSSDDAVQQSNGTTTTTTTTDNNHTSQQSQPQTPEKNTQPQNDSAKLEYEQSVKEKENSLLNSFSSMLIDENNTKNLQQNNGHETMIILNNHTNGNGHFENIKK